jgi:hypothetical protein
MLRYKEEKERAAAAARAEKLRLKEEKERAAAAAGVEILRIYRERERAAEATRAEILRHVEKVREEEEAREPALRYPPVPVAKYTGYTGRGAYFCDVIGCFHREGSQQALNTHKRNAHGVL